MSAPRATAAVTRPRIEPRESWASGLRHPGTLPVEEEVAFLLVHHTETPNGESREAVVRRLRSIHAFHTGEKGWPDVAYNFFVDGHGRIWEGRAGSLEAPVRGDATGGSQGHAVLCCFVGNHARVPPTPAAQEAMASLLAWLAVRDGVDVFAREVSFVSRGSNRWPRGTRVRTAPISGHRDVSLTECPGDAAYPLVHGAITARAQEIVRRSTPATPSTTAPTPTASPSTTSATPTPGTHTSTVTVPASPTTSASAPAASGSSSTVNRGLWAAFSGVVLASGVALAARMGGRRH